MVVTRNAMLAAAATGSAYGVLLSYRSDYLGHYLAGVGATLMLLCALAARGKKPLGWDAVGVTFVSIALGFVTESTIFRLGLFDPVDFCNQSLGACVACGCFIGTSPHKTDLVRVGAVSVILIAAGFVFAFA